MTTEVARVTDRFSHDFFYVTKWNCEINSREAFHINIFGILCNRAGAQNFAEGPVLHMYIVYVVVQN